MLFLLYYIIYVIIDMVWTMDGSVDRCVDRYQGRCVDGLSKGPHGLVVWYLCSTRRPLCFTKERESAGTGDRGMNASCSWQFLLPLNPIEKQRRANWEETHQTPKLSDSEYKVLKTQKVNWRPLTFDQNVIMMDCFDYLFVGLTRFGVLGVTVQYLRS